MAKNVKYSNFGVMQSCGCDSYIQRMIKLGLNDPDEGHYELREDAGREVREDGTFELRESDN